MMNIGGRIKERLAELGWRNADLLNRVPDLSPQALSNLIVRDSKRSEWDQAIASALGVSVLWLVYGIADSDRHTIREPSPADAYAQRLSRDEEIVLGAFRRASPDARKFVLVWATFILERNCDINGDGQG